MIKIALGSDHGGIELREQVVSHLKNKGYDVVDFGVFTKESMDYPDIVKPVCETVQNKEADCGILICGTGIGVSLAANKHKGIRAALCGDVYSAKMAKQHNDAQVICMGARVIGVDLALMIVDTYLTTEFEGDRHINRIKKIHDIENCQ